MASPVLYICYHFPPLGGPGVQRNLKNAKYLPDFGWHPIVLSVRDVVYHAYDPQAQSELGPHVEIRRTESLDPRRLARLLRRSGRVANEPNEGNQTAFLAPITRSLLSLRDYVAVPDIYFPWIPFAAREGIQLVKDRSIPVILARTAPLSAAVAAHLISLKTGRPYVLDFADGWLDDPCLRRPTPVHQRAHELLEKRIVGGADGVVVYSSLLKAKFLERYPQLRDRIEVIPNGFDPADFEDLPEARRNLRRPKLVYMGSLYPHQASNFRGLLDAIQLLSPALRASLLIEFVGRVFKGAQEMVTEAGLSDQVRFLGYRPHPEALQHLRNAAAGLIFIKGGNDSMVTGKVFEYVNAGVPTIASIPLQGQCADILRSAGQEEWMSEPRETSTLAGNIEALAAAGWPSPKTEKVEQFDRRLGTGRLADLLSRTIADAVSGPRSRRSSRGNRE